MPEEPTEPSLEDLLRKDAAQIPEPTPDLRLHRDTMRIIRNLDSKHSARVPLFAITAAASMALLIAIAASFVLPKNSVDEDAFAYRGAQASLQSYQMALLDSEDALLDLLSQDAASLLPQSREAFIKISH